MRKATAVARRAVCLAGGFAATPLDGRWTTRRIADFFRQPLASPEPRTLLETSAN